MIFAHRSLAGLCLAVLLVVAPRVGPGPRSTTPPHRVQPAAATAADASPEACKSPKGLPRKTRQTQASEVRIRGHPCLRAQGEGATVRARAEEV